MKNYTWHNPKYFPGGKCFASPARAIIRDLRDAFVYVSIRIKARRAKHEP